LNLTTALFTPFSNSIFCFPIVSSFLLTCSQELLEKRRKELIGKEGTSMHVGDMVVERDDDERGGLEGLEERKEREERNERKEAGADAEQESGDENRDEDEDGEEDKETSDMSAVVQRESIASSAHGSLLFSRMGHSRRRGELGVSDHKKKQELLLQGLAKMTKTLRSQTELVGRQLQEDVRILAETEDLTSDNLHRVNVEQTDLSEQVSRSCHENIFLWMLLVVLAILFFVTYSFIRMSKR
jgi:hypothetical protein